MIALTVERSGMADLGRVASGLREFPRLDYTPWFEQYLEPDFEATQAEQFVSEGARGDGGQWAPLSPVYAAKKAEHFPGKPLMQLSGRLRGSLTQRAHPDAGRRITPLSLERWTNVKYAKTHDAGTDKRMWIPAPFNMWINGVPRRPLIGVRETDVNRWAENLGEWVADQQLPRILGAS